ncbi:MAG: hypothetical protein WC717_03955 [Candidatus Micrarchaeia archaeon]
MSGRARSLQGKIHGVENADNGKRQKNKKANGQQVAKNVITTGILPCARLKAKNREECGGKMAIIWRTLSFHSAALGSFLNYPGVILALTIIGWSAAVALAAPSGAGLQQTKQIFSWCFYG